MATRAASTTEPDVRPGAREALDRCERTRRRQLVVCVVCAGDIDHYWRTRMYASSNHLTGQNKQGSPSPTPSSRVPAGIRPQRDGHHNHQVRTHVTLRNVATIRPQGEYPTPPAIDTTAFRKPRKCPRPLRAGRRAPPCSAPVARLATVAAKVPPRATASKWTPTTWSASPTNDHRPRPGEPGRGLGVRGWTLSVNIRDPG